MARMIILSVVLAVSAISGGSAFAYDFWGISLGTATYDGATQLTFDGVGSAGVQYVVGGYKYTRVDSAWLGSYQAAAPGEGFVASRKSDAQGLFFKADSDAARFMIIAGTPQAGYAAPECGTGARLFGPGDLKIDIGGNTLGVGMRLDNLLWAIDTATTNPECMIHKAGGGIESLFARDAGTLGDVELNPEWARMGHSTLSSASDMASAFFVSGTGSLIGSASVACQSTGISLYGAGVYAYEVSVPWSVVGQNSSRYSFRASWRPDCGNDILSVDLSGGSALGAVPEPGAAATLIGGLLALSATRRRF